MRIVELWVEFTWLLLWVQNRLDHVDWFKQEGAFGIVHLVFTMSRPGISCYKPKARPCNRSWCRPTIALGAYFNRYVNICGQCPQAVTEVGTRCFSRTCLCSVLGRLNYRNSRSRTFPETVLTAYENDYGYELCLTLSGRVLKWHDTCQQGRKI